MGSHRDSIDGSAQTSFSKFEDLFICHCSLYEPRETGSVANKPANTILMFIFHQTLLPPTSQSIQDTAHSEYGEKMLI